ncbi:tetratricopeptide repeat protein [Caulobacter endophyticus]|uniref:tetratricopeptide repeat protein n=1 Tax=Caulobacter endophyticus TaxID=2172652 RepID=UPI00240EBE0E|nr:tetratricopeptide repeat protein [Caulobacter endophyticus]MDG2530848.1 pilus assembly protein TadD [Caulobacter endophyticus]
MCRKPALLATVLTPILLLSVPAMAADKGDKAGKTAAGAPVAQSAAQRKAGAVERAEARRLDPLARAAFWSAEFEKDPRDAEAGVALSQALRSLGRYDDAVATSGRVLVSHPNDVEALLESARVQLARGEGFFAIEPARSAAAAAPRDWRPQSLLGVALEQSKRDDEALVAHRQAVALAPNEAAPAANLAMYLAGHGDLAGAETLLRKAVAMPSSTIQIRQNLALIVGLQGRVDEAEKLARQDLPPQMVDNNLAWLRAALGQGSGTRTWGAVKAGG